MSRALFAAALLFCTSAHAQNTLFPANPGDTIVRGTHAWTPVPGGTAGCVYTSNGPAASPTWQCALALNFLLPPMATNKVWGNVSGAQAPAAQIDVSQFLNTLDYDVQRPPLPGATIYKGTDNQWHSAPPSAAGRVWTSYGAGQIPQWAAPFAAVALDNSVYTSVSAGGTPSFATSFGLGGPLMGGESISAYGGNIVVRKNGVIEVYTQQLDGDTSTTGAGVVGATSSNPTTGIDVDVSAVANGFARTTYTPPRYGQTAGGWGEFSLFAGTELFVGTAVNSPLTLAMNKIQRAKFTTTEFILGTNITIAAPAFPSSLHVTGTDGVSTVQALDAFGGAPVQAFRRANGTKTVPTAVLNGDIIGSLFMSGRGATAYSGSRVEIDGIATQSWTDAHHGSQINFYTTPNDTIIPGVALILGQDKAATFFGALSINSAAFLMSNQTSWANGAAAQTATLTNAPTAGNPTKWIAINDNGTTRYIPTW